METTHTFTNHVKYQIRTTNEIPVHPKTYRYPFIHQKEVDSQIEKIVRPNYSPWSAPIWVETKKLNGRLIEKTIDDKYHMMNITDLLHKVGECQYFTTLDIASEIYQI